MTNFAVKALVRRMLGRAFVRTWLPFVAVPITAAWNAWVCFLIMREARIRAMGPSAAHEMTAHVFDAAPPLSDDGRAAAVGAVASSIVRTEDLHPNLVALLRAVAKRVGVGADELADLDDTQGFLARLAALDRGEQDVVLRILAMASIIDGRLTRRERRLLVEARSATTRGAGDRADRVRPASAYLENVERLRRAFVAGDPIGKEHFETL